MNLMNRFQRGMIWAATVLGGATAFQLGGCDENVKLTVFDGVESATTNLVASFVSALFLAISPEQDNDVTTVQAVFENLTRLFC